MGTSARAAIKSFKAENVMSDTSFGFYLVNEADAQLEDPIWASVFIGLILVLDVLFIGGFCFWSYWINQAKKLKSEK